MRSPRLDDLPAPPPGRIGWPWTEETPPASEVMTDGRPWPRISVTTPSFQQCSYLEETLRSVLLQGYPDLEYFVMDGGSTDGSMEIVERYAPWLSFRSSAPDGGQADAVNPGWSRSSGAILAYLNSDDVYSPGALATAALALESPARPDLVYSDCLIIDADGRVWDAMQGNEFDLARHMVFNHVPQPTMFVRRDVVDAVGPLDATLDCTHDHEFCARVGARYRLVRLPCALARSRQHASRKSVTRLDVVFEEWTSNLERAVTQQTLARYVPTRAAQRRGVALYNTAIFAYGNGDMREAARRFMGAARLHPGLARSPALWGFLIKCAAGAPTMRRLRAWRQRLFGRVPI